LGVFSGGWFEEKLAEGFGKTFSIVAPGVSVKPYPSGILSHQAMDAMLALVERADLTPEAVERIDFFAGSNILKPLGFTLAKDHLEAKFCMPALLSMIVLNRRAGKQEFTDEFVASEGMQEMQGRCRVILDEEIEAQGFDKIRSRIEVHTRDGQKLVERASEVYRGSPENPITDADLEQKLRDATEGILDRAEQDKLIAAAWEIDLEATKDAGHIGGLLPKVSQTA
jgi:2-methylcitrate dehydratase PrpD